MRLSFLQDVSLSFLNAYEVKYTLTKRGRYKMISALSRPGGLSATFYKGTSDRNFDLFSSGICPDCISGFTPMLHFNNHPVSVSIIKGSNMNMLSSFGHEISARWSGFIQSHSDGLYTFFLYPASHTPAIGEHVSLSISRLQLLNSAVGSGLSATM
jgi:hypothetical protein